jgi:hypothetical protein
MQQNSKKRLNTRLVFFWGMLFMYLGCAFLLAAFTEASRVSVAVASLFIIVGSFFAFLAVTLHKRAIFLFLATFSILVGFFLFLSSLKIVPIVLGEWWPAISIFAGLALIPTGWYYYGTVKPRYVLRRRFLSSWGWFCCSFPWESWISRSGTF